MNHENIINKKANLKVSLLPSSKFTSNINSIFIFSFSLLRFKLQPHTLTSLLEASVSKPSRSFQSCSSKVSCSQRFATFQSLVALLLFLGWLSRGGSLAMPASPSSLLCFALSRFVSSNRFVSSFLTLRTLSRGAFLSFFAPFSRAQAKYLALDGSPLSNHSSLCSSFLGGYRAEDH